jgi:arsenate reductase
MGIARNVVFVCLHGSAKSLIAAEYFRRLAAQQGLEIGAMSAGTDPDLEIPRHVTEGLLKDGIDVRDRRPRRVTREDITNAWRVVSFACELVEMAPPGLTIERWDNVPAVGEGFSAARDVIVTRLKLLLAECKSSSAPSAA